MKTFDYQIKANIDILMECNGQFWYCFPKQMLISKALLFILFTDFDAAAKWFL